MKSSKSKLIKARIMKIINSFTRTRQGIGDLSSKFADQARTELGQTRPDRGIWIVYKTIPRLLSQGTGVWPFKYRKTSLANVFSYRKGTFRATSSKI